MDPRKNENTDIKKDQRGPREAREELLNEHIHDGTAEPTIRNVNRDRARGDWDRTGDHHDEEA